MKSFLLLLAFMVLTIPAIAASSAVEIGLPAPDFTLTDTHGNDHKLSDYRGKTVVLEWTNHDCPYVRKHYDTGNMQELQKEATANNVVWLSIVSSAPGAQGHTTPEQANDIIKEVGSAETARLLDPSGDVGHLYAAKTTPHMFVIDQDGMLAYAGAIDDIPSASHSTVAKANNHVRAALADLAAGTSVKTALSKPYGCSVKYKD